MKRHFLLAAVLMIAASLSAVPARRVWRTVGQPDGTKLEIQLVGDESFHYFVTRDAVPVVERDGAYYYATTLGYQLASTGTLAHEASQRTAIESGQTSTVEELLAVKPFAVLKGPKRSAAKPRRIGSDDHAEYIGHKKGLIILANFSDKKFFDYDESDDGYATWQRYDSIANHPGYTNSYGAIGSVHDYYYNQSYGKFNLTFDVIGPVNLSRSYSYYGAGDDDHAAEMIVECCQAVDDYVNFADYDWDNDGVVEEVFVLYAGYGEATGGSRSTIWPHMWNLSEAAQYYSNLDLPNPFVLDGEVIDVYACSNELYSNSGTTQMGLGVLCHEFSHCLGLPDLYDTSYGGNFGMDAWDILDSGSYNGPHGLGWVPAGYSSYERWFAGWLKPSQLKSNRRISNQKPLNEHGQTYIIYNDNHPDEYYLLENRNQTGWDEYLPGSGLLIVHVDYDSLEWVTNSVNTTSGFNDHERLTVFHASNSRYGGNEAYPYQDNDSLTDNSTPAATLYNKNTDGTKLMHKPITQITRDEATGNVSFLFRNNNQTSSIDVNTREVPVTAYRIDGIRVARLGSADEAGLLPAGIYILRDDDGNSQKVSVP